MISKSLVSMYAAKLKKCIPLLFLLLPAFYSIQAQTTEVNPFVETELILHTRSGDLYGTQLAPANFKKIPVALIIAGSGPTDRDGNNPSMKNNSLKMLASALANKGIASLRYDKRGIAKSSPAGKSEADLRFDDLVDDARGWVALLKADKRFSKVIIIGHSEGSLIGMMAAKEANQFISLAGAGQSADLILKKQLMNQPPMIQNICFPIIDSLKKEKTVDSVPKMIYSLFRPSVQPYMISWFKHDPQTEISKLNIPTLIVQGTNDIQVTVEDAKYLAEANPKAKLALINNMNHILRIIEGDRKANMESYTKGEVPISTELIEHIADFILRK
jgi:pimeloyl-ACP methyl ester carboxylesterase